MSGMYNASIKRNVCSDLKILHREFSEIAHHDVMSEYFPFDRSLTFIRDK